MRENEPQREAMQEMYLREQAREVVRVFETLFVEEDGFETYMDAVAGYLDGAVVPDLLKKFGVPAEEAEGFYEQFRMVLLEETRKMEHPRLTEKNKKLLKKFLKELEEFEFTIPE